MGLTVSSFTLRFISHFWIISRDCRLGPFGQWFTRNETWAEQAQPWIRIWRVVATCCSRASFVADVVYFYGEDSNLTALFLKKAPGDSCRVQLRLHQRRRLDS